MLRHCRLLCRMEPPPPLHSPQRPPPPPVAELWPCTLPTPVRTVVAVAAPPRAPIRCSPPPWPPVATVEPRRELALMPKTLSVELALPPLPGAPPAGPALPSPPCPP